MSTLLSEIREQPDAIARLLDAERANILSISRQLNEDGSGALVIAARGTSDNAARYAQYLFGDVNHRVVALAAPSLLSLYHAKLSLRGMSVLGISQSGQSPDIVAVLDAARAAGSFAVAVTNDPTSPLARAADKTIALRAGPELSLAATKTYTQQLAALAMLSTGLRWGDLTDELLALPDALRAAVPDQAAIESAAKALAQSDRCIVLGRGYNYATTFEVALKIKELAYVLAEPYSTADFMHGPRALIEPGFPVILIAAGTVLKDELDALRTDLLKRKALLITLADHNYTPLPGELHIPAGGGLREWLSPIGMVLPGQLLAYYLARALGHDPDQPRTNSKVTRTR
jgi:glucosamine--fructose-6-phosphate aminotransferase (isomerizing)